MTARRTAGAAGLAYVVAAAIENMELLTSPALGSSAASIRAAYGDQALGIVTGTAGAVSLAAYVVFAAALHVLLRDQQPWAAVGLVGGIGGALVATIGVVASAVLVGAIDRHADETVRTLYATAQSARMVAGVFTALFLAGFGVALARARVLPRWAVVVPCALAVPLALAPAAAFAGEEEGRVAVAALFAVHSAWIAPAALWLLLGPEASWPVLVRRAAFLVLVVAAGLIGVGMLAAPEAVGSFFAWDLEPTPLAAFAGGVYVGSAAVYAVGLRAGWLEARALVVGAVVLSVTVLTWTLIHTEVFDFGRLQAWAWLGLFAGFSAVMAGLAVAGGRARSPGTPLPGAARVVTAALAVVLGALAVALWADPTGVGAAGPFALPPLGGRFAGSWIALLAVLLALAALRGTAAEARLPALALVLLPAGALVAALRTLDDLEGAGAYVAVLATLVACGAGLLRASRAPAAAEVPQARAARVGVS